MMIWLNLTNLGWGVETVVACRASHFIELPCQTFFCLFFISLLSVADHLAPTDVCESSCLLLELRLLICNFVRPKFDAQLAHLCCITL